MLRKLKSQNIARESTIDLDYLLGSGSSANQFFMYIDKNLIPWDIYDPEPENCSFVAYFGKVLQAVDCALPNQGLVFYVTMIEMKEMPSYGENVFVLILGDEFYRIPDYIDKVGGVFKCYGTRQIREQLNLYRPLLKLSYFKFLVLGQTIKNLIHRFVRKSRYRLKKIKTLFLGRTKIVPIYDIPPGYLNSEDLPIRPILDRNCDVFFDGSVIQHKYPVWSLRYWSKTPKAHSREQMVDNLKRFKDKNPQFQIHLALSVGFAAFNYTPQSTYSQNLMNTKICLAPRGTTLETYRLFEAMRYGCVIIVEYLPSRWFYNGAPVIQIGSWQNLEPVLNKLLNNPVLLQTLHQQTLDWWETKCSEKVVGKYMASEINALRLKF
ncbi:glycosyltransferase family 1 protein [Nodosilinea sp. LEGE 07298]|uniref:glycosyltransferase family 1 protein n=1 Tax=Nodosilinea sp. LEGE 07298 TaxID=2777970 RepID=UPI001882C640|nr:glycosyltransferase family 1 protein [Nodosilinea sp. LEGE 07298]MBE9108740.1 glycosyltransferase family 1 protein [Nodosilinea sp. LEGE 07298]